MKTYLLVSLIFSLLLPALTLAAADHRAKPRGESTPEYTRNGKKCGDIDSKNVPAEGIKVKPNDNLGILEIDPISDAENCRWIMMYHVDFTPASSEGIEEINCQNVVVDPTVNDPDVDQPAVSSGWGEQCKEQ
ncbi:MAG: hypothetical protein CML06_17430 [Pseudomonadales bacterium]|nr:hypothetical protein [Pseudomonadales bacterium]